MINKTLDRREFLTRTATVGAALASSSAGIGFAYAAGKPVESMSVLTANASFDPVRPEMGRLIAQAAKGIGWKVKLAAEDYNMGIGKVFKEQDFDMFIVRWTGRANRIDPETFISMQHHAKGAYNKWGYNNPRVNELAEAQQVEMIAEKRQALVHEAQQVLFDDTARSPIVYPSMTNAYREDRLQGLVPMLGEGIGSFWTDINVSAKQGNGYIFTGTTSSLKNLNPVAATDSNEFKELRMIYDRLVQVAPDGSVTPWAAKSIDIVDDTTVDIVLRDGMKFHDGKPVTIEDVKFTFDYHKQWKAPFFISSLKKFESVEITGANSLRIKLTAPHAPLMINFFCSIFILPQHIWKDIPEKAKVDDVLNFANEAPVGSGPFKFDYWDRGKEMKVSANKDHFSAPKCEGIIRITYGSHDAMAAAIEAGECDRTRYILKPALVQDLNKINGIVGKGYASHGFYDLGYNHRRGPLADPAFRMAMDMIIPRDVIRQVIMAGFAENGGSVIAPANEFWHNSAVKSRPTNVKKAREMLAAAGYTWDSDGNILYPG
ncbi:MAG: twin-arginine translocation pathway signal protein [Gammaproteobacteria bacterium]|nr:twin-arginine translocation pathway signal protein [Gammaproteobacteria bacterium]